MADSTNLTYLKLQNTTVMAYNVEEGIYKLLHKELLPFIIRDCITDTTKNENINSSVIIKNANAIFEFYTNRSLSINRENAKFILNQLGISQKHDLETKAQIMRMCKALSAADDYWITQDENEKWEEVNLRDNPLHETLAQIALYGKSLSITGKIRSPELTGLGAYAKAWFRENGRLYLYKAGTNSGDEPLREVQTSRILECFNVPQVEYSLTEREGKVVSKSEAINNSDYSIVDAGDVYSWCSRKSINFESFVKKIDSENYYKTIIADYLCANRDRHDGNWGFFMNNKTGELLVLHPLFDHNNCFDKDFLKDETGGVCQLMPGKSQKEAALYAVKRCSFKCIKPVTRDMFINDEMYLTFMARAEELGLYKKRNLSFFEKLKCEKNLYEPVIIECDDKNDYYDVLERKKNLQNISYESDRENKQKNSLNSNSVHKMKSKDDDWGISGSSTEGYGRSL